MSSLWDTLSGHFNTLGSISNPNSNRQDMSGYQQHKASLTHELVAGGAAFYAMREYEKRREAEGNRDHSWAREILASIAGAEIDKQFETKGLDWLDRTRAKNQAISQAHLLYDEKYGGGQMGQRMAQTLGIGTGPQYGGQQGQYGGQQGQYGGQQGQFGGGQQGQYGGQQGQYVGGGQQGQYGGQQGQQGLFDKNRVSGYDSRTDRDRGSSGPFEGERGGIGAGILGSGVGRMMDQSGGGQGYQSNQNQMGGPGIGVGPAVGGAAGFPQGQPVAYHVQPIRGLQPQQGQGGYGINPQGYQNSQQQQQPIGGQTGYQQSGYPTQQI
jgi:hypothetical protein